MCLVGDVLNVYDYPRGLLPANAIFVGRPSPWGNPFKIGTNYRPDGSTYHLDRSQAIAPYRVWLWRRLQADPHFLLPLVGHDLACFCAPQPCHADVLIKAILWRYGNSALPLINGGR